MVCVFALFEQDVVRYNNTIELLGDVFDIQRLFTFRRAYPSFFFYNTFVRS